MLRPAHLAFYKTNAEYKLLRLLDLSEIHSCTPVELKKHVNAFGIVSPTRTFYLQAGSPPPKILQPLPSPSLSQALRPRPEDLTNSAPSPRHRLIQHTIITSHLRTLTMLPQMFPVHTPQLPRPFLMPVKCRHRRSKRGQ